MNRPKEFLEFADPPGEEAVRQLNHLVWQSSLTMGQVRATFRCWPGVGAWVAMGSPLLVILAYSFTAPDPAELRIRLILTAMFTAVVAAVAAVGVFDVHRVCEHGLVLGYSRTTRLVVPWATVDPGRVRVVHNTLLAGRHSELPQISSCYRVGAFTTTTSLMLTGFDSSGGSTPFVWWILGTPRARRLAEAIEEAMVADGYAAQGLAQRAQRQSFRARWRRPKVHPLVERRMTDPVIGVDGPLLPSDW